MNVTMYGSSYCQDTLFALIKLKDAGVIVNFQNISTNFAALKEFMRMRETDAMFDSVKEANGVGMPLMVFEDGSKTLDWKDVIKRM